MIGIIIHLEDRWNYTQSDRDIDVLQMYQETVRAFNVDTLIIIDKTTEGIVHKFIGVDTVYATYKTLKEALHAYPDVTKIYFEHENAIPAGTEYSPLNDLIHPKDNVLYIFGGDEQGLNLVEIPLEKDDKIVSIQFTKYILWSIVSMTTVLYDRYLKGK